MSLSREEAGAAATSSTAPRADGADERISLYACYALAVLTLAGLLNYADRNIISILAERMKADLELADQQLGFLYGTAFAVFFAMIGIPMGRLADAMSRKYLMATGMALWSLMTVFSGAATNFVQLAGARIGVGLGEATANPCANSMLTEYFPKRYRATALAIYLVGAMLGTGCSLLVGGVILQHWRTICVSYGACGIASWQIAFFVVGAPGLVVAAFIALLKEPSRTHQKPALLLPLIAREFSATLPPFTFLALAREEGASGAIKNLVIIACIAAGMAVLSWMTGDWPQWIAVGLGVYSVVTWSQILRLRDRPLFELTMGCPMFVTALFGMSALGCIAGIMSFWAAPHAMRDLHLPAAQVGFSLGAITVIGTTMGIIGGGVLTDLWKQKDTRAPFFVGLISLAAEIPTGALMYTTKSVEIFFAGYFVHALVCQFWGGGAAALVQDLVLPRMRGAGAAAFSLVIIIFTLAMGPYWSGKISSATGALQVGVLCSAAFLVPFAAVGLLMAARRMPRETEAARWTRARAFGEP